MMSQTKLHTCPSRPENVSVPFTTYNSHQYHIGSWRQETRLVYGHGYFIEKILDHLTIFINNKDNNVIDMEEDSQLLPFISHVKFTFPGIGYEPKPHDDTRLDRDTIPRRTYILSLYKLSIYIFHNS